MPCPMRVFVALFSVLLIAAALLFMHAGEAQWALKVQRRAAAQPWWRFVLSLFSGEVVYIALYGQEVGPDGELLPPPAEAEEAEAEAPAAEAAPPKPAARAPGSGEHVTAPPSSQPSDEAPSETEDKNAWRKEAVASQKRRGGSFVGPGRKDKKAVVLEAPIETEDKNAWRKEAVASQKCRGGSFVGPGRKDKQAVAVSPGM